MRPDETYISQIDGKWYAYAASESRYQVYSIGSDCPKDGGVWVARWTDSGIKYVASPSASRDSARKKAQRYGTYCGVV